LLCGRAAAYLYRLLSGAVPPPEVTTRTYRRIAGVRTRRLRIDARDEAVWRGIPVTTVPRALVDLAGVLVIDELARACHEASIRYGTNPPGVEAVLARWPNAPGAGQLRSVLYGEVRVTLSRLEKRFLELLENADLPLPEMNRPAGGRRVDCRWPEFHLTIELDSYRYHSSRHAWEQDRRREREARARGDELRRYTFGDVFERPRPLLAELRTLMKHRAAMASISDG
jgi:hypothetical protein